MPTSTPSPAQARIPATVSWVATLVVALTIAPPAAVSAPLYTATELLPLAGYDWASASAINNQGRVVGTSQDTKGFGPVTIWENGQILDLGAPSSCGYIVAEAVNDVGKIVGRCDELSNANGFAWKWENGSFQLLPGVESSTIFYHVATDVNEAGRVCGGEMVDLDVWALAWDTAGIPEILTPVTETGRTARGVHITESDQVVGYYTTWDGDAAFFLWEDGVRTDITPVHNPPVAPGWSLTDANDGLTIIGRGAVPGEGFVLFDGTVTPLETLPGHTHTNPSAINEQGTIVGRSWADFSEPRATVWTTEGKLHDLNDVLVEPLGFVLERALDINDDGAIVGWGRTAQFEPSRAFLLTPMPVSSVGIGEAETSRGPDLATQPSPFGPGLAPYTKLTFDLAQAAELTVDVIDVSGRQRRVLHTGLLASGPQAVTWNGRDGNGRWLASGTYWLRVRGKNVNSAIKVTIQR